MTTHKIGRLAMRVEGNNWNAYYALTDTMVDAVFLGSIALRFVPAESMRYYLFINLMRGAVADIIEELTGERPEFPSGIVPAPEHERSGNA